MADRGIDLIGPEPRSAPPDADGTRRKRSYQYHGITADYEVERFIYNADADLYVCPQGRRLVYDAK